MIISPPKPGVSRRFAEYRGLILITSILLTLALPGNRANSSKGNADEPALALGDSISREIAGGGQQTFESRLAAGQYLRVLITKQDLHLSVKLYGPEGRQLFDFQSRRYGPLAFSFVPETTGLYRLDVRSLETEAVGRPYQLRVEALGEASQQDRKDADACKAFYDAERLRAEWKEDSLRDAIRKYDEALTIWRSIPRPQEAIETLSNIGEL